MAEPGMGTRVGRESHLGALLLVGAVISFVAGYATALSATPGFSWHSSMISDLGSRECIQRGAHRTCSPLAGWFNAGLGLAGLCVLLAAARLRHSWGTVLTVAMAALGAGLVLVATVPSDVSPVVHMAGAVLALPVPAAGLLVSGIGTGTDARRGERTPGWRGRVILGAVALLLCLDHLPGDAAAPIPRGLAEAISVAALLGFLLLEARRCWSVGASRAQMPEGGPHAGPSPDRSRAPEHG